MSKRAKVGCTFQALIDEVSSYLRQAHFDGKPLNEISVKSLVLHLSDDDWNNLVTHWSRLQRKVLSMISHHNLNYIYALP